MSKMITVWICPKCALDILNTDPDKKCEGCGGALERYERKRIIADDGRDIDRAWKEFVDVMAETFPVKAWLACIKVADEWLERKLGGG